MSSEGWDSKEGDKDMPLLDEWIREITLTN
jgi:hypothetical protein